MLAGGHGEENPNASWLNGRGMWLSYVIGVLFLHLVLLAVPFFSVPVAWTLTNVIHNGAMFIFLHTLKGCPWVGLDQGKTRAMTHWEQIDYGKEFTASKKFLTVIPILLFILASFYTKYDAIHFVLNFLSLVSVLVPKLPEDYKINLFAKSEKVY
ncbi:unnamed protein product [Darwinula stevensoni]|uniref:ORM1-like protein n=1 Tax=Darwinula stevensoni TaxID=69355 RepID=A0A7R9A772_9CRUS|nr:unnamed protein product [Darwinula stevensoni]CAG0891914.1 unnamed protein product [Darwinula stevensoni]